MSHKSLLPEKLENMSEKDQYKLANHFRDNYIHGNVELINQTFQRTFVSMFSINKKDDYANVVSSRDREH